MTGTTNRLRPPVVIVAVFSVFALACGGASGGSPASSSSPTKVAVGQTMKAKDGKSATVTAFKRNYSSANQLEQPAAGKECVQVNFALLNGSPSEWSLPTYELKVVDNNGQKYDTAIFCGSNDNVSSLVAGGKANPTEYYEVPKDAPIDLVWQPNVFDSETFQTSLK